DVCSSDLQAYLKGEPVKTMLEISVPVLKNSLFVVGMDFTILDAVFIDPSIPKEKVFGSTKNTHCWITALKNSELYYKVKDLKDVFYFPSNVTGLASLCVNIRQNNQTTYRLVMLEDNRKIEKNEGFLLKFVALLIQRIISPSLVRNPNGVSNSYINLTNILLEILCNDNVDYLDIGQKLSAEKWLPDHEYICLCVKLTEADKRNYTFYPIIYYWKNLIKDSCPFLYKNDVVVFINMTLSNIGLDELMKQV